MERVLKSEVSDMQLRAKLEEMILGELLGPAGGENEELVERNVRDRYLVGVLASAKRSGQAAAAPTDEDESCARTPTCRLPKWP